MILFLILLTIIAIYVGTYLYDNYCNYSIQYNENIKIDENMPKTFPEIIFNNDNVNDISSSNDNINDISNSNYIDKLMLNSNLNIVIPEYDNPGCIGSADSTNLIKQMQHKTKTQKMIDMYLSTNMEHNKIKCDNFNFVDDSNIDVKTKQKNIV